MYPKGCFARQETTLRALYTAAAGRLTGALAILFLFIPLAQSAVHLEWRPIPNEDLALKQSKIDPNADAEALFREVWIDQQATTNYLRFKIFNARGREKYSDVKIEYWGGFHISEISARTIHPDGTIIDLGKDAIFDQVEAKVKRGNLKVKVVGFALPSVEPGSIIEYRWTENDRQASTSYFPLDVQSEYPVDEVTFHVKPILSQSRYFPAMRFMSFGCHPKKTGSDSKGYSGLTVRDVPAYHDEPFSPPELASHQWILAYYNEEPAFSGDDLWTSIGKFEYKEAKEKIKIDAEMKQAAAAVVSKGKTEEEKLALLADYCRKNIKNVRSADITTEERERFRPNKNSAETLRRMIGTARDIDLAFIALAQAAGYNARLALVADRRKFLFNPSFQSSFFLNNYDAAVQIDGKWKFYDVSDEWAPPGTLAWREQNVYALIPDPVDSEWVTTPLLTTNETRVDRIADLALLPNGDLEGDIRELYWGNKAIGFRKEHLSETAPERQESVNVRLKEAFSDFELTKVVVTISPDANLPAGITYHLLVKGYAQRTGTRLFVRPSFFTTGESAYFPSSERANAIYFDYPWSECDTVTIRLPNGYQLDHADSPVSLNFPPAGQYIAKLAIDSATKTLTYQRALTVGANQQLLFERDKYEIVKAIFDRIHTGDEYMIALKAAERQPSTQE